MYVTLNIFKQKILPSTAQKNTLKTVKSPDLRVLWPLWAEILNFDTK